MSGREAILTAEVDLGRIPLSKFWFDPPGHSGRPDVFDLRVCFGGAGGSGWSAACEPSPAPPPKPPPPLQPPSLLQPPPLQPPRPPPPIAPALAGGAAAARQLGLRINLGGASLADVEGDTLAAVLDAVWRHGVVCVEAQALDAAASRSAEGGPGEMRNRNLSTFKCVTQ